jgi:hypothetical protein
VRLDHFIPADAAELGLGAGAGELLAAAIEYLEREPAAAADDKVPLANLSPRELHLVLVYFTQEGRDAYCALEGFDGLCRADRVDGEELMTAIACGWIERLVGTGGDFSTLLGRWTASACAPGSASSRMPSRSTGTAARGRALSSSSGTCSGGAASARERTMTARLEAPSVTSHGR